MYIPKAQHAYQAKTPVMFKPWFNIAEVMDGKTGYSTMEQAESAIQKYLSMYADDTDEFKIVAWNIDIED